MAWALKPKLVPMHQGISSMTIDTRSYAGTFERTSEAKDFYQKAVAISKSARFPDFNMRPNIRAVLKVSLKA
jgi:hypothetical protein